MIDAVVAQIIDVASAARTELLLFFFAIAVHHALFGTAFPLRRTKGCGSAVAERPQGRSREAGAAQEARHLPHADEIRGDDGEVVLQPGDRHQPLQGSLAAYQRGDHRGVLRCWSFLRKSDQVPAAHLAHVVESMQRFKKDGAVILAEVVGYLRRNPSLRTIAYVNKLLEPLARSLDTGLVLGLARYLPSLDLKADAGTYELLLQMHFTTRGFEEVGALACEMKSKGITPTRRSSLVLLKTALQLGRLDEAVQRYREVSAGGIATASAAPKHIAAQLVELACREHRLEVVLTLLEAQSMTLTAELLNVMLTESSRTKDQDFVNRLEELASKHGVEKNGRTYGLLVRCAGNDEKRVTALLEELAATGVDCTSDVAQAVLAVCAITGNTVLADRLRALAWTDHTGQAPWILTLIRFYAEAQQPRKACKLYDAYLKASTSSEVRRSLVDARTERSIVAAALQCGREDLVAGLMEAPTTDSAKYVSIIRSWSSKGNLEEAMKTFHVLEASGAELTHSIWNSALDACVECQDLRRAEDLMKRMEAAKVADTVSYNTLIKAHLRQENYDHARCLMDKMQRAGYRPNHVTYNELINALVRNERDRRHSQVWDVVEEMKENGVQPNRITCSILLKSLKAKSSHVDIMRTMELTDSMEEPMDEVLLSSLVEACVRVGKPALLSQRLEQLQGKNAVVVTGAHTFGSLIKAYGCAKNMDGAWRCWKEMRSQHVKPTSITIGCMVEAVVTNGDVDGGHELISTLLEDPQCREQVNAVVFGSVLKGYGRAHCMERVWAVFDEMLSHGIEPSVVTYNAVINSCTQNGQMDRVRGLLEDMRQRRLEPNLITYSTMIKGFCQQGDMQAAFSVLGDLRKDLPGGKADEVVYNTLLDGCLQAGLPTEGERLILEMQKEGLQPSAYTLTVIVKLLGQARRLERAFELVETAPAKFRVRPNSHVYNALLQACISARDPLRAATAYEHAARERQQLDSRTCQSLVRSLLSAGHCVKAVSLLRAMFGLNGGVTPFFSGERAGAAFNSTFLSEVLTTLLSSCDSALAAPLLRDLRASKLKVCLDPAVEQQVADFTGFRHMR
mmetsp:Transcript_13933/g.32684  ORF Transcript_13933/g.32684 Transcript_13933/m.32684 type:complete len:1078 (-) Transcript_13933:138-3371(-)